jgi:uncharacterized protein (DUF4415 family)
MAERGRHMIGDQVIREARSRGRPPKAEGERKEKVTLRLSPDVIERARSSGSGWQTRLDEQMRRIQEFQDMVLTGKEPPPRNEIERQMREVMRRVSESIGGTHFRAKSEAATNVMRRVAADHERIAMLLADMIGTTPLASRSDLSKRKG